MDRALRAQLEGAAGRDGVNGDLVTPSSVDGLLAAVRALGAAGTPFRLSGSADGAAGVITLSTARLTVVEIAPQSLTLRAESGVTPGAIRDAAARHGLAVVGLQERVRSTHAAALVANGEVPRRSLCGVEAVTPVGERIRFGGGVLKDVVGYDLPSLLLGSRGRLAIITAMVFRLEPAAARTPVAPPAGTADGLELFAAAFDPQGLLRPTG